MTTLGIIIIILLLYVIASNLERAQNKRLDKEIDDEMETDLTEDQVL